jgi:hypothetical protein
MGMTGLEAGTGVGPKNKNAGLVGPAASLSLICGERLVYVSCPRGSFKLFGSAPLRTFVHFLLDQGQTFQFFFEYRKRAA